MLLQIRIKTMESLQIEFKLQMWKHSKIGTISIRV